MSRSYKHTPYCGDKKRNKNLANQKVRRSKGLFQGSLFKKLYSAWDICDYYHIDSFEEFYKSQLEYWYKKEPYTKEQALKDWNKYYKRK